MRLVLAFFLIIFYSTAMASLSKSDDIYDIVDLLTDSAVDHGIPPEVLISLATHESGDPNKNFKINPYALNVKGRSVYPSSKVDAYKRIIKEVIDGKDSVGVGVGQIEWKFHSSSFGSYWEALDVHNNVNATTSYLKKMYKEFCRSKSFSCAVAAYHNRNKDVGKTYLSKVIYQCVRLYGEKSCEPLTEPF
ncbi:transglycosylase SLT domain-containing protein [Vibrio cholerae]|uniref:transglycosylase SLT domain-containing protein n=1 Tax=Vibrio cholerae TaxID=666 RepID=UPI000E0ACE5A|nr:transglycosylase SLT domain-containing protein [Vibrio cholerae]